MSSYGSWSVDTWVGVGGLRPGRLDHLQSTGVRPPLLQQMVSAPETIHIRSSFVTTPVIKGAEKQPLSCAAQKTSKARPRGPLHAGGPIVIRVMCPGSIRRPSSGSSFAIIFSACTHSHSGDCHPHETKQVDDSSRSRNDKKLFTEHGTTRMTYITVQDICILIISPF
jgi:hypothetical protein